MFCFPCYVLLFKLLLLNHFGFETYYVADVEALVLSFD